ncbi:MAG: ribosome biogenesis GTP-binding protein YihA/YsxC [Acidobacteria bacterium]|nr:ribosome biogenesis GTP-binding protein YihA/YsxC [Acidobacteriota bacterium]
MKVTTAEFVKSAFEESQWARGDLPEVAFLGRSNVGKSSLMNSLLGVRGLARTSRTPGRTQAINFFLINKSFRFVDLPGYGYARVSKQVRESWGEIVTAYLAKRARLVLSIHLVDSRHDPTQSDLQLSEWLASNDKPRLVVATKADKLSRNGLQKSLRRAREVLGAGADEIVAYSSVTGMGRERVWREIEEALAVSQSPL